MDHEKFYSFDIDDEDFWLTWTGFNKKLEYEREMMQMQSYVVYVTSFNGAMTKSKPVSFEKFIGKKSSEKGGVNEKQLEILKKMKEQEALLRYKSKKNQ